MAGRALSIDVGSKNARVLVLEDGKRGLVVRRFMAFPRSDLTAGLAAGGIAAKGAVCGLGGRAMTLRYTQVPPTPDWQLRNLMELEIQDMAGQSGGELSADYNLLPIVDEEGGMETVLLAFAKNDALDETAGHVRAGGGSVDSHVPNCIALYNAYVRGGPVEEDAVVCLVNLGHETIDLAIARGVDLLFVRNLAQGGKVFDDAIVGAFNVSERKAESLKKELLDLDPFSRGRYASGQAEKITVAAGGAGSMIVAAVQSSLAFCRKQTQDAGLQLDKVLICGGTSRIRGIEGMLREALRVPVEVFDPFDNCDLSKLPRDEYDVLDAMRREAVVALGLAAGKVDGSLYQLEILPESVKRRRQLLQQTVWCIGAAAVAVALLLGLASRQSASVDAAELANRRLIAQRGQYQSVDSQAERLVTENEQLAGLVSDLAERAVPLDGAILTLRALQASLEDEIWLSSLEIATRSLAGDRRRTNAQPRPVVIVEGKGKDVSGEGVLGPYQEFLRSFKSYGFRAEPVVEARSEQDGLGNTKFTLTIDFRPPAEPASGAGD
ncbi:MAG: pilus assembly protein PilM [Planctomycetes bacterium]|nr:pilus assembly protein PilM [Planctomycetota bacterium]